MRKVSVVFGVISALALFAACGPDSGGNNGGGNNGGGSISAEEFAQQFPQAYAEAICKSAFQCPDQQNPVYSALIFGRVTSEQDCVDSFVEDADSVAPIGDVESGVIDFDAQAASSCLDAIDQRSSGSACAIAPGATPLPSECFEAARGTLAVGEECATDGQCASGSCDPAAIAESCTGECVQTADVGESCVPSSQGEGVRCNSFLVCVPEGDSFVCAEQGSLEEGDACSSSFDSFAACGGGLYCTGEQGNRSCTAATTVEEGADCSQDGAFCTSGTVCIEDVCSPPGGAGDPCSVTDLECKTGLYCDTEAGECAETKPSGASCESDSECSGDLECSEAGSCEAPEVCTLPMN